MFDHPFLGLSRHQALRQLSLQSNEDQLCQRILLLIRARLYKDAECELLILDSLPERHSLLLLLRIAQGYLTSLRQASFFDISF